MIRIPATLLSLIVLAQPARTVWAIDAIDFEHEVAPILAKHCLACHSDNITKGDVSLSTFRDLEDNGFVISGDAEGSYLVELISSSQDSVPQMPRDGDPLSTHQVDTIRRWIDAGANWPDDLIVREASQADASWWSLQRIRADPPPTPSEAPERWLINPIDRFVWSELARRGLHPNGPADRRTMIRRISYDLTGLPPTPDQVREFQQDDHPLAYEKLVDRLLASSAYGERWGRHWLDVVRFGESSGFEQNFILDTLWPFRDYVIDSINADESFDQLIREHIAGDVLSPNDPSATIGSAFLVAGPYDAVNNQDAAQAAQIRANTIDEMIRATSEAFLGLTVGCARCHDHKFDPILQKDYYSMYAVFAGVRHGEAVWASKEAIIQDRRSRQPLLNRRDALNTQIEQLRDQIQARADQAADEIAVRWTRPAIDRRETVETFPSVKAKFIRLVSEGQDAAPGNTNVFNIDEFEVYSHHAPDDNLALARRGAIASGVSRQIEDFAGAYGPQLAIDGAFGERFLATGGSLTIELPEVASIDRVVFSSGRIEQALDQRKFNFVGEYRLETSLDGQSWQTVADSHDRLPMNDLWKQKRLFAATITTPEQKRLGIWQQQLANVKHELDAIAPLPKAWIGKRNDDDAKGPFHVFIGGSPQRPGEIVDPRSLVSISEPRVVFDSTTDLQAAAGEADRRRRLAQWITDPRNPLTPRVLANRVWHYHFGTGIVSTPSDFGYMGSRPTHPRLLDFLARFLIENQWRLKPLHRLIVTSQTYRQSGQFRQGAADVDAESRWLWRFPPRRLSAEEVRDTILQIAGVLRRDNGGPGFRLYRYTRDNVSTYFPLDHPGPETYRRAVYHQNARAAVVDLMTEFDQPDCAFSTPRRSKTTTPLQALTMMNHPFTMDMADRLADRVAWQTDGDRRQQLNDLYQICYQRDADEQELAASGAFIDQHGLVALCRVLLNTSELIHVE